MNPLDERRRQDLAKITRLGERSRGRITISEIKGAPLDEAVITLAYKTAPSPRYPHESRDATRIRVVLSSRYPFQEPAIEALDPLYNPNVYTSGRFCLGAKWLPTEGLDMLVARVAKIITFNPEIVSDRSPANMEAAQWYNAIIAASPDVFPTDRFELEAEVAPKKMLLWSEVKGDGAPSAQDEGRAICPSCSAKLRVYDSGTIRCPACESAFETSR
ncbi:MAG: ubiquitin-conjugating enzyme E2 [Rhodospirillaceae bacterium]